MNEADDKPLPNLDPPSVMEPLLKRIAEGVERLEKKQPPAVPPSMSGGDPMPPMPPRSASESGGDPMPPMPPRSASESGGDPMSPMQPSQKYASGIPDIKMPQTFANAGNIQIDPQIGQEQPSVFGRAAIALQSMTNMMADYGLRTSPAMHSMTSYAKVASAMAGDVHTRGEGLAGRGVRPSTGGDQDQMMRSLELVGKSSGRGQSNDPDATSPQIARNDLKDSLDSLKESIDQLKEALKESGQGKQSTNPKPMFRQAEPSPAQSSGQRSRPTQLGSVNPDVIRGLARAFGL